MPSKYPRAFLAIQPPEDVREELFGFRLIPEPNTRLRRVPRDNIHLTVRFLGAISADTVEMLPAMMNEIGRSSARLPLTIEHIAAFPSRKPVVIAGGIAPNADLDTLAERVTSMVASLGIDADRRPFRPHITIARLSRGGMPSPNLPVSLDLRFTATELVLFESKLNRDGAEYFRIHSTGLGD